MAKYRGMRMPRGLPGDLRRMLKAHDHAMQTLEDPRSVWSQSVPNVADVEDNPEKVGTRAPRQASNSVSVQRVYTQGDRISADLPIGQPGEIIMIQYGTAGTQPKGNLRLRLADDYHHGAGNLLMVAWDGQRWTEQARTGGVRTVLNVAQFGALGGIEPCHLAVQEAVDTLEIMAGDAGGVIFFPKSNIGEYHFIDSVRIRGSHICILLEDGVVIQKKKDDSQPAFNISPDLDVSTTKTVTVSVLSQDIALTVASGDEAAYVANDWALLEDAEAAVSGSAASHAELVRIRSTADGVLNLYWPVQDNYSTGTIQVTKIQARENYNEAAVVGFTMMGRGIIKCGNGDGIQGGNGIVLQFCHDALIVGVRFTDCFLAGIQFLQSDEIRIQDCHFENASFFDIAGGYGFRSISASRVSVTGCTFNRLKHAALFDSFSQNIMLSDCLIRGTASHAIMLGSNVKHCTLTNNNINGAVGLDDVTGSGTELSVAAGDTYADGIHVSAACQFVMIQGNQIANTSLAGVRIIPDGADHISVLDNILQNTNIKAGATSSAVHCCQVSGASPDVNRSGIIVRGNTISTTGRTGISVGCSQMVVADNYIKSAALDGILISTLNAGGGGSEQIVARAHITGNYIEASGAAGIKLGDSTAIDLTLNIVVEGNFIYNCLNAGILLGSPRGTHECFVDGNYIMACNTAASATSAAILAIEVGGTSVTHPTTTITNNICIGSTNGIIIGVSDARVKGNTCISQETDGIRIINPTGAAGADVLRGVIVVDNDVYNAGGIGIVVGNATAELLLGCNVLSNRIQHSVLNGIYIASGCVDTVVADNFLEGNNMGLGVSYAILVEGDKTHILNNTMVDAHTDLIPTQAQGIDIDSASSFSVLQGNYFRDTSNVSISDRGTSTLWLDLVIPVTYWGVSPSAADNTAGMQRAIDEAPIGSILFVPPGEYQFTSVSGLNWDYESDATPLGGITGYGAVFNWGNTVLTSYAFRINGKQGTANNFPGAGTFVKGLKLVRDTTAAPTSRDHSGFQLDAAQFHTLQDCVVQNFKWAIELTSSTGDRCQANMIINCNTRGAWRHFYLHPDQGTVDNNMFLNCRVEQLITDSTELLNNVDGVVYIDREVGALRPVNNIFQACDLKIINPQRRGILCAGTSTHFILCSYINLPSCTTPIEIGNTDYASGEFAYNVFYYGNELHLIVNTAANVTFTDSGVGGANARNQFYTGGQTVISGGNGSRGVLRLQNAGSATLPVLAICRAGGGLHPIATIEFVSHGTASRGEIRWNNTSETQIAKTYVNSSGDLFHDQGFVHGDGYVATSIETITGNDTLDRTNFRTDADATSGNITVTLPAAASHTGRIYHIRKIDSSVNLVTVDASGSETINGALTVVITTQWDNLTIQSNGTSWGIL